MRMEKYNLCHNIKKKSKQENGLNAVNHDLDINKIMEIAYFFSNTCQLIIFLQFYFNFLITSNPKYAQSLKPTLVYPVCNKIQNFLM